MEEVERSTRANEVASQCFGLGADALVGEGVDARAYAIDQTRVAKIYCDVALEQTQRVLQTFYDGLVCNAPGVAVPKIQSVERVGDCVVTVEDRLDGLAMNQVVRSTNLTAHELEDAYVNAIFALSFSRPLSTDARFRVVDLESSSPLISECDWHQFLRREVVGKWAEVRELLDGEAARSVGAISEWLSTPYGGELSVIHGDLYPGNILVDASMRATGVIDFGNATLIGDSLFDVASACGYYDMYSAERKASRDRLLMYAEKTLPTSRVRALYAYLLIAALLTCDKYPSDHVCIEKTGHFRWANEVLTDIRYAFNIAAG